jgi:hypothetical protein
MEHQSPPVSRQKSGSCALEFAAEPEIVSHHRLDNVSSEQRVRAARWIFTVNSIAQIFFSELARTLNVVKPHIINDHNGTRPQKRME